MLVITSTRVIPVITMRTHSHLSTSISRLKLAPGGISSCPLGNPNSSPSTCTSLLPPTFIPSSISYSAGGGSCVRVRQAMIHTCAHTGSAIISTTMSAHAHESGAVRYQKAHLEVDRHTDYYYSLGFFSSPLLTLHTFIIIISLLTAIIHASRADIYTQLENIYHNVPVLSIQCTTHRSSRAGHHSVQLLPSCP